MTDATTACRAAINRGPRHGSGLLSGVLISLMLWAGLGLGVSRLLKIAF